MAHETTPPILVVGAGTTGMTMACELARHGAPVRIVDKLAAIAPHCRATGIHSRTLEVFQDLGVVDEVLALGQRIVGLNQFANGVRFVHTRNDEIDSPFPFTLGLEQWKTEGVLEGLLGRLGVTVERETELIALEDRLDGVRATLRRPDGSQESVDTPWLVACDGAHSRVRHLNHQHFPGEVDPRQYVIADVVLDMPHAADEAFIFLTDAGVLYWFPLPDGRNLLVADLEDLHDAQQESPKLTDIQALLAERGPAGVHARDPRWLAYFRIHYRISRHYRRGRTLLAGDAVHVHSLIGGHGMNTGIQDAYNLAWKLALVVQGRAPESLLDSYEKERRAVAEDVIATTRQRTERSGLFRDIPEHERDRLYRHLLVPEAERLASQRSAEELDLDYRRSPICSQHLGHHRRGAAFAGGPHAGAQAGDAAPLRVNGRSLSLFELIAGPRHTLLLFVGRAPEAEPDPRIGELAAAVVESYGERVQVCIVMPAGAEGAAFAEGPATLVRDAEGALHDRYAAHEPCLYLVRPDGYVGLRSEPPGIAPLREHLARVLSSPTAI